MAVVGAGHWGPNLVRNFHAPPRSEVGVVVDRDEARLAVVRQKFPGVATSTNADAVFADPSVQAVVIATPTTTHAALVRAALNADKHVLVEKPITSDSASADELAALAASKQRVLLVGHVFIYNQAVRRVHQMLRAGDLGRVYYVSMVRTNLGPIRMDVDAAWDLASHDISIACWWMQAAPLSVSAVGGCWINEGIDDATFATLRFPDGVLCNLHVSWLNPRKARDITVVGEKKMLTFDDMNLLEPIRIYDKQVTDARVRPGFIDSFASFRNSVRDGDILIPKVSAGEPLKAECDHFLDCIESGVVPMTGGALAAQVVRTLEAMDRSRREQGREVAV